jgi:hypothetical protein
MSRKLLHLLKHLLLLPLVLLHLLQHALQLLGALL